MLVSARRFCRGWCIAATLLLVPALSQAQDRNQVATSSEGMVVTAHPLATFAGHRILQQGGNAADAAVAAAFAVAVVRPSMNSIGGRNQILIRTPSGEVHGIDGLEDARHRHGRA